LTPEGQSVGETVTLGIVRRRQGAYPLAQLGGHLAHVFAPRRQTFGVGKFRRRLPQRLQPSALLSHPSRQQRFGRLQQAFAHLGRQTQRRELGGVGEQVRGVL